MEVSTPYDGAKIADLSALGWDLYSEAGPSYEQPADLVARLRRFMAGHDPVPCVVVTHGDLIAFAILESLSRPLTSDNARRLSDFGFSSDYPPQASITEIIFSESGQMSLGWKEWNHAHRIEAS